MISIDDVAKLDIRFGRILNVEKVEGADKLLKLSIDLGEESPRQIVSGISLHYPEPEILVGRTVPVIINLEPRMIRGVESNGMVLYAVGGDMLCTVEPSVVVAPGTPLK